MHASVKHIFTVAAFLGAMTVPAYADTAFTDLPEGHWAYDAVEQLVAEGIITGYPDGTFRGSRTMTRYEIATIVARAAKKIPEDGRGAVLNNLISEFEPELQALGARVDNAEGRINTLEKNLGGWKISGELRFDAVYFDKQSGEGGKTDNGYTLDRARIFLHRDLPDGISFDARWHRDTFDRYYLTINDTANIEGLKTLIGAFSRNWENYDQLYNLGELDSMMMDCTYRGFDFQYTKGSFLLEGIVASDRGNYNMGSETKGIYRDTKSEDLYGARLKYNFGEKLWISANALWSSGPDEEYNTYWAAVGYTLFPGVQIRAAYFVQDIDEEYIEENDLYGDDSPTTWKVILDIDQNVLKFTSLWVEYVQLDAGFILHNYPWGYASNVFPGQLPSYLEGKNAADVDVFLIRADQKLNAKWTTKERYLIYDTDDGDAKEWGIALRLQYSPTLSFELGYVDYDGRFTSGDDGYVIEPDYDNKLIRLQTWFHF